MLADFHSHTTLSDGSLTFEEMVTAAEQRQYDLLAITDHVRAGEDPTLIAAAVRGEIDRLSRFTNLELLAGVELTDLAPHEIPDAARTAREAGAQVIVVHGECLMLDTPAGTNAVAARCREVDILAHPGMLAPEDAEAAAEHNVYIELSAYVGASYANGHILNVARRAGAPIVVDSDAHAAADLLTPRKQAAVLRGAGAPEMVINAVTDGMTRSLVRRLSRQPVRV